MLPRVLIPLLFFLSGLTSLVYETLFCKLLGFVFGSTAYATSTVLASFMGGLALGSWVLGRWADRVRNPLRLYGWVELAVGAYAVLVPGILSLMPPVYVAIYRAGDGALAPVTAAQVVLTGLVILVPTFLMGGTLPLVSRALVRDPAAVGRSVGALYSLNTFGAAAGVLLATYVLIFDLGVRGTLWVTAAGNVLIFLVAWGLGSRPASSEAAAAGSEEPALRSPDGLLAAPGALLLLVAAFLSGFNTIGYEVLWTHVLAAEIGTSVYAFGIMLFTFLVGLAVGAAAASYVARWEAAARWAVGLSQVALGLVVILLLPVWPTLPDGFVEFGKSNPTFARAEAFRAWTAFRVMAGPTFLMGMAFPLVLRVLARDLAHVGARIGTVYFVNTIGSIGGSLVAGFVVLAWLGAEKGIVLFAGVSVALGLVLLAGVPRSRPLVRWAVVAGLAVLATVVFVRRPAWDLLQLTRGTNVYLSQAASPDRLIDAVEDIHSGIVTVTGTDDVKTLWTNGKFQGDDRGELRVQRGMALTTGLLMKGFDRVLVIGMGTGCTVGNFLRFPVGAVDVAEIAPGIVGMARKHFAHVNDRALDDPRVTVHLVDGRNFLMVEDRQYDAIAIELTSVWFANAGNLYSREFYELAKARLRKGGLLQQWIQMHHIAPEDVMVAINSMREVFPHVSFWHFDRQGLILGSDEPVVVDAARVEALAKEPGVARLIREVGFRTPFDIAQNLILDEAGVDDLRAGLALADLPARISTDDNLYIEHSTPMGNLRSGDRNVVLREIVKFQGDRPPKVVQVPAGREDEIRGLVAEAWKDRLRP